MNIPVSCTLCPRRCKADRTRAAALDARADALLAEFVPRADEVFSAVSGKLRNK